MRFLKRDNKSFLISGNDAVEVPQKFDKLTEFILDKELCYRKILMAEFKDIPKNNILECIKNLLKI